MEELRLGINTVMIKESVLLDDRNSNCALEFGGILSQRLGTQDNSE